MHKQRSDNKLRLCLRTQLKTDVILYLYYHTTVLAFTSLPDPTQLHVQY